MNLKQLIADRRLSSPRVVQQKRPVQLNYCPEGDDISTYPRVLFSLSLSTVFIAANRSAVFTHTGGDL